MRRPFLLVYNSSCTIILPPPTYQVRLIAPYSSSLSNALSSGSGDRRRPQWKWPMDYSPIYAHINSSSAPQTFLFLMMENWPI